MIRKLKERDFSAWILHENARADIHQFPTPLIDMEIVRKRQ